MTDIHTDLHDAALEAAADLLLLEGEVGDPPAPAIAAVCQTLGIGVSTFYQLFEDKRAFDGQLAAHRLASDYQAARTALTEEFEIATEESVDLDVPADGVLAAALAAFYGYEDALLVEAMLVPWIDIEPIREAYRHVVESQIAFYEPLALTLFDIGRIDATNLDVSAFVRTLYFASIATSFTPQSDTPYFITAAVDVLNAVCP